MRISQAVAEASDIEVPFGSEVLRVRYRPLTYTVREMTEIRESQDEGRIVDTMLRLLESWDLTQDDGTPVPIDADALRDVPTHIFAGILKAVAKEQEPDPEVSRRSVAR